MSRRKAKVRRPVRPAAGAGRKFAWRGWLAEKAPVFRFAAKFALILGALYAVFTLALCQKVLPIYLESIARIAHGLLHAAGESSQLTAASIWSPLHSVTVTAQCSALEFTGFLAATILALPASWSRKLPGLALGFVLLSGVNVIRVASLYFIGVHGLRYFPIIHENVWPAIMVVATVAGVAFWIDWALRPAPTASHAAS